MYIVDGLNVFGEEVEEVEERKREVWQVKISSSATCLEVGRHVPAHLPPSHLCAFKSLTSTPSTSSSRYEYSELIFLWKMPDTIRIDRLRALS